jgi:hypothetical protein
MNSKKAKLMRKLVRQAAAQVDAEGKPTIDHSYFEIENRARTMINVTEDGKVETVKISSGQLINTPGTKRAMYKTLKKSFSGVNIGVETPEVQND